MLAPSRFDDPVQKIMFVEGRCFHAAGGRGVAEQEDANVYLVLWQGALRDHHDVVCPQVAAAIDAREPIAIELLYSDQVGEQRTISRFSLTPYRTDTGEEGWFATGSRHWFLDRAGPRPEDQVRAAAEAILRLQAERADAEAAQAEAAATEAAEAEAPEQGSPAPTR